MSQDLKTIYSRRFAGIEKSRDQVWKVLTRDYFQQWVNPNDVVLDVGAGFCEFINNIQAGKKIAVDLNPATLQKAAPDVTVISQDVTKDWPVDSGSVDVVFTSNFFEHLSNGKDLLLCLKEIRRVLRPHGLLLAMGPNIRFCSKEYWDFFDHFLALSDRSLAEALEISGFQTESVIAQFLPYTMKGKLPPHPWMVRLYLRVPMFWRILGKQFLIFARNVPQSVETTTNTQTVKKVEEKVHQ
jgi:SAM-dependent methyltransferase